jgi:hypothetical protein
MEKKLKKAETASPARKVSKLNSFSFIQYRDKVARANMTLIDQSQLQNHQLSQLTAALRQQMLKEIRENQTEKSMNSRLGESSLGEIRTLARMQFLEGGGLEPVWVWIRAPPPL